MRSLTARVVLLASVVAIASCTTPIQQRAWIEVSTPNFRITSSMSPAKTTEFAIELERFRAIIATFTNAAPLESPVPTKIFIFRSARDFKSFTGDRRFAGWFNQTMRSNLVALAPSSKMSTSEIVLHEYVHFAMHNATTVQYPTWYSEGFAEYLGATTVHEDELLILGAVPKGRGDVFGWVRWLPLTRIVSARGYSGLTEEQQSLFYAQSWALVHYLHQGREGDHYVSAELDHYMDLVETGSDQEDAFEAAFGISLAKADKALQIYLKRGLQVRAIPLSVLKFEPPETVVEELSQAAVSVQLGELALSLSDGKQAQSYYEAAVAADPTDSRAQAGLGDAHKFQGHWTKAEPHFRKSIELAPDDAFNQLDFAEFLHDKALLDENRGLRTELLSEARRHYVKSQMLDPSIPETYALFGSTFIGYGQDPSRGIETIELANRMLPSNTDILDRLATAYLALDRKDDARGIIERRVAWSHAEDREQQVDAILAAMAQYLAWTVAGSE
jgi:tetratricopeptide (TPR) repeat protein